MKVQSRDSDDLSGKMKLTFLKLLTKWREAEYSACL